MERNNENSKIMLVIYNDNNYQFASELIKPINIFYNEICSYLQIDPNQFVLYYDKQKIITDNNNQQIINIIKNNQNPIFKIVPKKTKISEKKVLHKYNHISPKKDSSQKLSNYLTISMQENRNTPKRNRNNYSNYANPSVMISQVPSIKDIQNILVEFNNKQNNNNDIGNIENGILISMGNNAVRVEFNSESILNEFISYISFIKYQNNYYKNIIIQKDISSIRKSSRNLSLSQNYGNINDKHKRHKFNNSSKMLHIENNIKIEDVIRALKQKELNNDCYHGLSLSREGEDEIITDYYRQQNFLRNSSPYISENEKRILEEKENKKHFFKHKDFVTSVGKYSMKPNFIPNYVGMTPSENPNNHEFRNVDKKKWITNKGFNV